jgi:hypothetical protein
LAGFTSKTEPFAPREGGGNEERSKENQEEEMTHHVWIETSQWSEADRLSTVFIKNNLHSERQAGR